MLVTEIYSTFKNKNVLIYRFVDSYYGLNRLKNVKTEFTSRVQNNVLLDLKLSLRLIFIFVR